MEPTESPPFVLLMNIINTITHILLGAVTVVCCIFAYQMNTTGSFARHVILCVLGYVMLMSEAILTFNRSNSWSQSLHHKEKKYAHLIVQVMGSALAIAGSIIRIQGYGGTTFSTPHGILGWIAMILTMVSFLGGLVNMYLKKYGKMVKIGHALLGSSTLILAFVCLCLGMDKTSFRNTFSDSTATTLIVFTVVALVSTLVTPCINAFRRLGSSY